MRVFYDEDADLHGLDDETVAVLGYGIQGRAQALNLRDSGVRVVVGNRSDEHRDQAAQDGFSVLDLADAALRATVLLLLIPDEAQPHVYAAQIAPALAAGNALVFAHGFAIRYGFIAPPHGVDVLLLAPRMPGQYVRQRYLDGWGVPAFVAVERDASGRAWPRLLALARAIGATRCAAIETSFAEETELDHFSQHFIYPLVFSALEMAFEELVRAGYAPEAAVMELHGSGELGEVLQAAAREGLYEMIRSHASPACQVGIAHHWQSALGRDDEIRARIRTTIETIRRGTFARMLRNEQEASYPDLREWQRARSSALMAAERRLRGLLRRPPR